MVIEFYYNHQSPCSQAVWMLLEELGLQYKKYFIDFMKQQQNSEEYTAINPHQKVPAIIDGDLTLTESRAIAIYLCEKYDKENKLYPNSISDRANFNKILFRDVDNYQTILKYLNEEEVFMGKGSGPKKEILPHVQRVMSEIDDMLSKQEYIFGDHLTFLDFFVVTTVYVMSITDVAVWEKYENIGRWRQKLEKLPYFEEAVNKPTKESFNIYRDACKMHES